MAVITISRQFGAGGRTLGAMVAERLNYQFLDDTIIQELSHRIRVSENSVVDMEKIAGTFFSKIVSTMLPRSYMERIPGEKSGYIDEAIYVETLKELIVELAKKDRVVLLGRGSQYILSQQENAFHFLLIADMEQRIRFMQRRYKMSDNRARQQVFGGEKRRRNVYAKLGATTFDDPATYHMVLNMSRLDLEEAVEAISTLVQHSESGKDVKSVPAGQEK